MHPSIYWQKWLNHQFIISDFLEQLFSKLAELITVVLTQIPFIPVCTVPFTNSEPDEQKLEAPDISLYLEAIC